MRDRDEDGAANLTKSLAFRLGAVVILGVVMALRWWSVGRWTWMFDDWVYMERSRSMGFVDFLFQNYNGHVMPGEFLVVWVVTRIAPLSHPVVVVLTALAATGVAAVWAMALREICGERLRTLLPLVLVALTPLQVQATIWWASALQALSLQAALGGSAYFAARLARRHGRGDRVGLLLTFLAGMLMWEKAVLLYVPIVVVLVMLSPRERSARRSLAREVGWVTAVAFAYSALYLVLVQRPSTAPTPTTFTPKSPGVVVGSFGDLVGHLLAPALLGGPWGTLPTEAHPRDHPGAFQVAVTVAVLVGLLVLVVVRRRQAWLAVLMTIVYGVVSWGLVVGSSRFDILGLTRVGYERYAIDTFVVLCLAVALSMAPEVQQIGAGRLRSLDRLAAFAGPGWSVVVVALLGSLALGNLAAVNRVGVSPARAWVDNVTADVHRLGPVSVFDSVAPGAVLFQPFWGDHARLSRMLSPLGDQVRFDRPADRLYVVTARGRLVPATVGAAVRSRPGPVADCGFVVAPRNVLRVPMTGTLYDYHWGVQVHGFAGHAGTIVLEVGGHTLRFAFRPGLNAPQAAFIGPVGDVLLRSESAEDGICVTDVVIGGVAGPSSG